MPRQRPHARIPVLRAAIDPRRLALGHYVASSNTPAYAQMHALCVLGGASEKTIRRTPDGVKVVLFKVGRVPKRNDSGAGRITVSARFFQTALQDYANWPLKWWRESVQNSADAGARNIELGAVEQADGTWRVWCQDDGKGMSRDVLINKFLVLGASGKDADTEATGGFGKAKEMLLLPWLGWSVTSQGTRVDGAGIDYRVIDQNPPLAGTRVEVVMPADNHTTIGFAAEFLQRCHLPKIKFTTVRQDRYTNGEVRSVETQARTRVKESVREVPGKANVFWDKKGPAALYVRINGMFMFERYVPDGVVGTVIVELTGKSTDLLTANRDSIRDDGLRRAYEAFLSELAADTKSALVKRGKIRKIFKGSGAFAPKTPKQAEADLSIATTGAIQKAVKLPYASGFMVSDATIAEVMSVLAGVGDAVLTDGDIAMGGASAAVASATLAGVPMLGQEHLERAMKHLAWQPDFFVMNDLEDWKVPPKYLPEKMSKKALTLAKTWAELVRLVFIRLNSASEYGIGWNFSDDFAGMYTKEQGQHWILLNPVVDRSDRNVIYDPSDVTHLAKMWSIAIHESTHCIDGISYHNDTFAGALTENYAKCADAWPTALRIAQAIAGGAAVQLREALRVAEGGGGKRGRAPAPRIVEKIVERIVPQNVYVDRPVDRFVDREVFVDRPVYVDRPVEPVRASATPRQLSLHPTPRRSPHGQGQLGLKFNSGRGAFVSVALAREIRERLKNERITTDPIGTWRDYSIAGESVHVWRGDDGWKFTLFCLPLREGTFYVHDGSLYFPAKHNPFTLADKGGRMELGSGNIFPTRTGAGKARQYLRASEGARGVRVRALTPAESAAYARSRRR